MNQGFIKSLLLAHLASLLIIPLSRAQEKTVNYGNQQWVHYFGQWPLSDRLQLNGDTSFRWKDGFAARNQYIVRIGFLYKVWPGLQIGGGFAQLGNYGENGLGRLEFRPHQDLALRKDFKFFRLNQRLRIEERFFDQLETTALRESENFHFRFRYALTATIPLFGISSVNPERKMVMQLGDEIFLNGGNQLGSKTFDQNRILISPTLQWNKSLSLALCWSSQYASTEESLNYNQTDIFWLQIRQQFEMPAKKRKL